MNKIEIVRDTMFYNWRRWQHGLDDEIRSLMVVAYTKEDWRDLTRLQRATWVKNGVAVDGAILSGLIARGVAVVGPGGGGRCGDPAKIGSTCQIQMHLPKPDATVVGNCIRKWKRI